MSRSTQTLQVSRQYSDTYFIDFRLEDVFYVRLMLTLGGYYIDSQPLNSGYTF